MFNVIRVRLKKTFMVNSWQFVLNKNTFVKFVFV